jgi:ATP/maltotriose-dependent transcriptional regulator MalT
MADAAWWSCRIDDAIAVRQNAYAGYLNAKDLRRAGSAAWRISEDFAIKGESAAGLGWLKRAQRHLSSEPECIERGFLAVTESDVARTSGDLAQARSHAARAVELGERCDSLDLHAMGIQALGRTMIASGEIREGMALLDEAMALVLSRRLNPLFTGIIYCNVVAACMARADLGRASEWTEAAMAWCGSIADLTPYHGICRMHRVEIMTLRGAWDRAEAEALQTVQEMHGLEQHVAAEALYAIGEIHLHRGELDEAEDWFMRAYEKGRDPQPGLAAVRVAQGKVDAAATGIRLALASAPEPTLHRARLLAAQVDVLLEHRDLPAAWKAAEELERLTSETPSPLLDVITMMARASLHLAGDEIDEALRDARRAWSLSQQLKLPHFAAKARMITGLVAGRMGDIDRARIELEAARTEFERLGASLDVRAVSEHLRAAIERPGGLSARELEVLRMVAAGRTNREIAAVLVISEKTVSRHLENIFRKLDVSSRAAATAFAFKHELV